MDDNDRTFLDKLFGDAWLTPVDIFIIFAFCYFCFEFILFNELLPLLGLGIIVLMTCIAVLLHYDYEKEILLNLFTIIPLSYGIYLIIFPLFMLILKHWELLFLIINGIIGIIFVYIGLFIYNLNIEKNWHVVTILGLTVIFSLIMIILGMMMYGI